MIIFSENELKKSIQLNEEAIAVVEEGFNQLASGNVVMPPIMRVDVHDQNGEVDVKTAYVKGKEMFAIKVSSGFFNNHQLGLPSGSGLMMLISTKTGVPQALLLDHGYLTEVRTAAAGAIAAKYLANEKIDTVGMIGAGSQARFQLKALKCVRNFSKVLVYARSQASAEDYANDLSSELGVTIQVVEGPEHLVKQSDLVVTATPAAEPLIKAEWLHPGLHITAIGADAEHKQELESLVLREADIVVCDAKAQCSRLGELRHALKGGVIKENAVIELGEMTSKKVKGRENPEQITVCDLTGTGVQDTVIALFAYEEMKKRGLGVSHIN